MIIYRTRFLRKFYSPFKPFIKPIIKYLFPNFFKYDTIKYWTQVEGPHYFDYWKKENEDKDNFKLQSEIFMNELKKIEFKSILDYGCGYGRILKLIETNFPNRRIYGCDISRHQINNAKKYLNNRSKCDLFYVNGKEISKPDNSYDLIFTVDVLLHQTHDLIDIVRKELLRVSKRYILIFETNFTVEEVKNDNLNNKFEKTIYKHNHIDYFIDNGCKIIRNYTVHNLANNIMLFEKI